MLGDQSLVWPTRYAACVGRAQRVDIWRRLRGLRRDLVKFDEVARGLSSHTRRAPELAPVPLHQIVGSVGRARDFTREFLPRPCVNRARWEQIERAMRCGVELPPVELFRMDDVYFVVDGHHRISVARAQGAHSLDALVTRLDCALRLTAEDFQHGTWLEKVAPHRQEEQERLNAA